MSGSARPRRGGGPLETSTGLALLSLDFKLLYADPSAIAILSYPDLPRQPAGLQARIDALLDEARGSPSPVPSRLFASGRRTYACRAIRLEPQHASARHAAIALLFERVHRKEVDYLLAAGALFHLSPRQRETVWGVMQGLTTKEIAAQMGVSPHTVKQFIRQSMDKLGVTTRAGIVGRVVSTDVSAGRRLGPRA